MTTYQVAQSERSGKEPGPVQIVRSGLSWEEAGSLMNQFSIALLATHGERGVTFRFDSEREEDLSGPRYYYPYRSLKITYRLPGYEPRVYRIWIEKEESND